MAAKPLLITFSGLDGSGKSTQIALLRTALASWRKQTKLLAFWDDVVTMKRYREGFVHVAYRSEHGIGAPGKPVCRRDKNVKHWYLTVARHIFYLLDTLHLRRVIARACKSNPDVIVMDRYIYDEFANLPLTRSFTRSYVQWVNKLAPQPDVAFLLDVDPAVAVERKPEYPVEFMRECRESYAAVAQLLGIITIVPAASIAEARQVIEDRVATALAIAPSAAVKMRTVKPEAA